MTITASMQLPRFTELDQSAEPGGAILCELKERGGYALAHYGAMLFRGTSIRAPGEFRELMDRIAPAKLSYRDGNSPRTKLAQGIYTSTEYPAEYFISLHNELSYAHQWPEKLFFCCLTPAVGGGETVIADSRSILETLDPALVDEFERRQVRYVRNLHGGRGLGRSWQQTFETDNRSAVEEHCRTAGMSYQWTNDGGLRLTHSRPATTIHPVTGIKVWFNQADQFHPSTHPPEEYEALMSIYEGREEELPQFASFGDGGLFPLQMLEQVRAVQKKLMVAIRWQEGDVLGLDNVLVAHGRMPYSGPRRILVTMA